jgi:hypothetical protein
MSGDLRNFYESRFIPINIVEEAGGTTYRVEVNGNRHIDGLSREQTDQVDAAIRHAMSAAIENTISLMRSAMGIPK